MKQIELIKLGSEVEEQSRLRVISTIEKLLISTSTSKFSDFNSNEKELIKIALENQIIIQDGDDITSGKNNKATVHYFNSENEQNLFNKYNKLG